MLYLDKKRLESVLNEKGLSLNNLANRCGISRQSIYEMTNSKPVFNTSFLKVCRFLNITFEEITYRVDRTEELIDSMPDRIKQTLLKLTKFAERHVADLIYYGERGRDRFGPPTEWSFGIFFSRKENDRRLRILRQELTEESAPYRISIENLNRSPLWMLKNARESHIRISGESPESIIFERSENEQY